MHTVFNVLSALAAALAARYWLLSARVELPTQATVGYGGVGGSQDQILASLKRQSRLSALAARWASVAALLQVAQVIAS